VEYLPTSEFDLKVTLESSLPIDGDKAYLAWPWAFGDEVGL
jgi:hypothetical protein